MQVNENFYWERIKSIKGGDWVDLLRGKEKILSDVEAWCFREIYWAVWEMKKKTELKPNMMIKHEAAAVVWEQRRKGKTLIGL